MLNCGVAPQTWSFNLYIGIISETDREEPPKISSCIKAMRKLIKIVRINLKILEINQKLAANKECLLNKNGWISGHLGGSVG